MQKSLQKLRAIVEITRPKNCLMASAATMLGYWLSVRAANFPLELFFVAAATFAICGAGQAINDYYDRDADFKAKKNRAIARGALGASEVKSIAIALFLLGISLAAYANERALGIAVAFAVLLYAYSYRLASFKFFGNALVALATAFTYVMGATISAQYLLVAVVASASFFATWGREITKDLEDLDSDRGHKTTLPMVWGKKRAAMAAHYTTAIAIALGLLPYLSGMTTSPLYLFLVLLSAAVFAVALFQIRKERFKESQKTYKAAMMVALVAYASMLL